MNPPAGELDPVIHAQARLRVVSTLAALNTGDQIAFTRLQNLLDMTPGNLITHLRKLEASEYITSAKRGSATYLALTTQGRSAFEQYVRTLRTLLQPAVDPDDEPTERRRS
ncbi:transcriptional regulator [Actinoalloteichus hymeniacidonis]|uniref:Winged helix DNA-binding domain n=1 Tax=Actinoalloteichus hymeniacidonis TaxID=340345 RepID=A0AAC9HUL9_9PSEU|nr:transcriptional regulator [Actinoalloteichus hymeniacidonis]AOS65649.1 Winged helix DNA-binding domain [Actinoalloteichus hymeniacidonis]MBB5906261.1 DNA-binding MarR family transcriptional regulator [Actinoalloteichus hymeniacidonis]